MKKLSFLLLTLVVISVSSCKKTGSCTIGGNKTEYSTKDYTQAQLNALETACKASGGTWE